MWQGTAVAHLLEPAVDELYLLAGELGRLGELGELLGAVPGHVHAQLVKLLLCNRNRGTETVSSLHPTSYLLTVVGQ